jgi:hypothetical protein
MFLAGYGGMVSLVQMTVAAVAGYAVAILGTLGVQQISLGMPWWSSRGNHHCRDIRHIGRRFGGCGPRASTPS